MTNHVQAFSQDDFVGAKFGDFVALRPLAKGPLTTLYLARRASLRSFVQPVAMHVFHPQLVSHESVQAALNEQGRVASYLDHPGIGRVFDFGEANGTFYAATQYVFGETLAMLLRTLRESSGEVRLSPQLVAHVFAQACDALHRAHMTTDAMGMALQVVHGGLSPSHLHVGYDGAAHVLNFGLAKIINDIPVSRAKTLKERLPYVAPEQLRHEVVDLRTDVWSLGVMLREALSGRRAFEGKSATDLIHGVLSGTLPGWPDHVPQAFREIAERAMQRDPRSRYPDAQAMSADLRALCTRGDPTPELRMETWMRAFFSERMEEKQAMLHETFRGSTVDLSSRPTAANALQQSESPTLASPISEGAEAPEEDAPELERHSEPISGQSHIRFAPRAREGTLDHDPPSAFPALPAVPTPPAAGSPPPLEPFDLASSAFPAAGVSRQSARRRALALALGALLLGIAVAVALSPLGAQLLRSLAGLRSLPQSSPVL